MTKEHFKNFLNRKSRKRGRGIWLFACICIAGANSLVGCRMGEEISDNGPQIVAHDEHFDQIHDEDSGQIRAEDSDQIEIQADDERVVIFAQDFIDQFNGTIAGSEEITLTEYIGNSNLLAFAEKMILLTKRQDELGMNAVIYGAENEFNDVKCEEIEKDIYYVKTQFRYEGSGMTCQLIIKKTEDDLEIMDFYFGTKDGVDTISTGHHAERKVDNPNLWNEEDWVMSVNERLIEYEGNLQ
ncbi:MAG: hypothetical protein K2O32_02780 [Acetatifactor sp.]|nr:hypothetical protein [Acetatifactor sp.]